MVVDFGAVNMFFVSKKDNWVGTDRTADLQRMRPCTQYI